MIIYEVSVCQSNLFVNKAFNEDPQRFNEDLGLIFRFDFPAPDLANLLAEARVTAHFDAIVLLLIEPDCTQQAYLSESDPLFFPWRHVSRLNALILEAQPHRGG